jgi:thioredoxin-like negative regulator of GroEL
MLSKTITRSLAFVTNIKGKTDYLTQAKNSNSYILNFSAGWCGPCKAMAPIISKKETEAQGKWKLFKVDIDDEANG